MSSKFLNLEGLKESLDSQNPIRAREIVENACKFFDQDLTSAELALASELVFNEQTGTLAFVNKSITQNKRFTDSNVRIFELWAKLIKNYCNEISFGTYIDNILATSQRYVLSTAVSAKEKEFSTIVLQEVFQSGNVSEMDISPLVVKLMNVLVSQKSKQTTFLQEVYILLGTISNASPSSILYGVGVEAMRDVFLKPLETILVNEQELQYNTLTGALQGLNLYLKSFAPSDAETCKRIYICMKRLSDPMDSSKKSTFRASIDLFTAHASLLSVFIFKDALYWHTCLNKWLSSSIYDDRRKGIYGTHAFHNVIAAEILSHEANTTEENDRDILRFFVNYFREKLVTPGTPPYLVRIAIRGFAVMAAPCKRVLPDILGELTLLVIQRSELVSIAEDNDLRDTLEHFPDYVEALSQIITITDDRQAMEMLVQNVESITTRLIKDFHYLSRAHTQLVVSSLLKAFWNLSKVSGNLLDDVLDKVILSGIIWTCSHKLIYDARLDWSTEIDWKDNITYKSYLPLWEGLIVDIEDTYNRALVAEKVFNSLMKNLFIIVNKLDLRTKRRVYTEEDGTDKEFYFCDPNIDLCPVKPQDFHIFFNVVDFYKDLFWIKFRNSYFSPWIQEFCTTMLRLAVENPLVSGFMKLLEIGLVKADFLQFFDDTLLLEVNTLRMHLQHFLKHLIVKCQKISGELQMSCLELILKYPGHFYADFITALIPIFEIALDIGKSTIWLAKLAVGAFEKILKLQSEDSPPMKKLFKHILPCLDSFLRSKGFEGVVVSTEIVKVGNKRRMRNMAMPKIHETELFALQRQIMSLLGQLSPQTAMAMILDAGASENFVKWEMEESLRCILHFPEMRPSIYLDTIMPRICELAVKSSDRKTKVSACEMVHAVILYSMGTRQYQGQIWKELCRCMLTLGADSDKTVQQMFEPLLTQVMHYMSKYENLDGVEPLMEALMAGISSTDNSSIRDLSAVCLREFVEWSIKQVTAEQLAASAGSIGKILEHLRMYSFDSDGRKRNGAALAFNNLYRILRQQEAICDNYFIDLLYTFCVNFKLSEEMSSVSLTEQVNSDLDQVSMCLDHVVRVLRERNDLFNIQQTQRLVPSIQELKTLRDVVVFLFREGSSKLMNFRLKCIGFTKELAIRVENVSSYTDFINKFMSIDDLKIICEGESTGTGIKARPNLTFIRNEKNSPYTMIYSWLQHLLSALDCYCWLLDGEPFVGREKLFEDANIFNVISYYLNDICWEDIAEILNNVDPTMSISSAETILQMNSEDTVKITTIKTILTVRTLDFICSMHKTAAVAQLFPSTYWTENRIVLTKFINQLIFEVHRLNFDFRVQRLSKALPMHIKNLMQALNQHCTDESFVAHLQQSILNGLSSRVKNISTFIEEILNSDSVSDEQQDSVLGIQFVCSNLDVFNANEVMRKFLRNTSMELFSDLFVKIKKTILQDIYAIDPCPAVKKLVNQLMSVCFTVNNLAPNVVHCLLDTTVLKLNRAGTSITHGIHFLTVYKRTIFEFCEEGFIEDVIGQLLRNITMLNFHQILDFLVKLIDHLSKSGASNKHCLSCAIDYILANLSNVIQLVDRKNEEMAFTKLLAHLVNACPFDLHTFCKKAPDLETWLLEQLKNSTSSLKTKSNIIYLLPTVVGPDDNEHEAVTKALEDVQRQYLPLRSCEFAKNSSEETALKYVFKYLLDCLVMSRSYVILEFLIKCTASDSKHTIEWIIRDELKSYILSLPVGQQCAQLNRVLEMTGNRDIEPAFRLTILERFLLTMIQNCGVESLVNFFTTNIKRMSQLIETNYGSGNSGWLVEQSLVDRIVGYALIEVMFGCLPKEKLCRVDSPIAVQLLGQLKIGTEMVGIFTKKAFYARLEVFVTDDAATKELFRKYQCAAFRVVCSLVSNTQADLQFYSKFIFEENRTKNEFIWAKLIDCTSDQLYAFDGQESEDVLKIKERFTSIRRLNPRPHVSSLLTTQSSRQLQTQSVFQSSLSQDVVKLDLNYSKVRTDAETMIQQEKLQGYATSVRLERNVLNKHEIMPTLCGVVEHMFENEIAPKPPAGAQRPYKWILAIAAAMENSENHKNVRLFVAQFVQNCRELFKFYGYALFGPILQVLVDECAGTRLNFFVTDLIAMLLSWTSNNYYTPTTIDEKRCISQLVKFLMKNAWHEKRPIFKFNLELIQSVIVTWKECISVPTQLLMDSISQSTSPSSRDNSCGIIILGLTMSSGLEIWTPATKETFLRRIITNLQNEHSTVYQSASTVLGMMLEKMRAENDDTFFENQLPDLIQKIKNLRIKNEKKFMDIVYGIHKHFPEIVDSFREVITFRIPLALGTIKSIYLEMFLTRIDAYASDDLYRILISIGISDILKNLDYQLLGLHIINRAIRKMSSTDAVSLLPKIEECLGSKKSDCRDVAYEILIYLAMNSDGETAKRASLFLLNGLMDPDTSIQNRIFHFWSSEKNLTDKIEERILDLISQYGAKCEKQFLGFCTQLLLQLAIENPESKRQVFEFQTDHDSKLMEYNINTAPNTFNTNTLPPLFAESHNTRRSLILGSQSYSYVQNTTDSGYTFEPTLDPMTARTPSELFSLPTQSGLPFMVTSQVLQRNSQKVYRPMVAVAGATSTSSANTFDRLRQRFLKDKEKETRNRVLQIVDNRVRNKSKQATESKRKQNQVVLFRRYRNGDYPDLLINHLALLLPLQGLVRNDSVIAREVFVSIFTAVIEALGPSANMFIISISSQIQKILENVKLCDSMVFATFLEVALLQPAKFDFPPELVAMLAKATNMLTSGVIYLESRINADWDTDLLSIKTNSSAPIDGQHWLHLSEIYNSLAEYDLVSSIFADKMRTDSRLADAIDLRANGRYADAQKLLLEIIHRRIQIEHHYAYICYFDCFVELGDWSQLRENVRNQIDDFEELWTDDYNMSYFLPNLMQAELQLILQNKSEGDEFLRVLESWTADPVKSEYIKRVFSQEMMMLNVANRDFLQARVYGESSLKMFLLDWSVISTMNSKLRLKNLLNAQIVAEIDHYALMLNENFNESTVAQLNNRWERCSIKSTDSLRYWNCVVSYRTYIGHLIQDMLGNVVSDSEGLVSNELQNVLFKMHLQLFNAAVAQENSTLSSRVLDQLGAINQCANHNFNLQCDIARIKHSTLSNRTMFSLERAWTQSDIVLKNNVQLENDLCLKVEVLNMLVDIGEQMLKSLSVNVLESCFDELDGFMGDPQSVDDLKRYFFQKSLTSLRHITDKLEIVSRPQHDIVNLASKNFYKLAQFCYDHREKDYIPASVDMEELVVKYVLLAMRYDSKEACQMFPSILQLPSLENQTLVDTFHNYAADVPEWMFLTWIPQILSRLDFDSPTHLDEIVRRLAVAYPNALVCPFTVWFERFESEVKRGNRQVRIDIQEIMNIIQTPVAEMFIRNFKILCLPGALLGSHLDDLARFLNVRTALTQQKFVEKVNDIISVVFDENAHLQGRAYRNIQTYKHQMTALQRIRVEDNYELILDRFSEIRNQLRNSMKNADRFIELSSISPWLANFQWCGEETFLEVPGQYETFARPKVFDHIKIVKFGQKIEVFTESLRKPLRIAMHGSDGKSDDYLVKYGEDVKQDQRIQQILRLMSSKLSEDQQCRNHGLMVGTFQVTPMGQNCGMMSWVRDSMPLDKFIQKAMLRRAPNDMLAFREALESYANFIENASRDESGIAVDTLDLYGRAVRHYSRNQLSANLRNLENAVSVEIIKMALVDMSVSPDSFYMLRNNFATSLAAMNISNWILGIGDRHLANIVISIKTATLTGVDFGYNFGCGLRNLAIPELTPFRLTSHLVGTMNPWGTSGVLAKCMSHSLRVFRNSRRILMACMEVFIQEPTIAWINAARMGDRLENDDDNNMEVDMNWEPKDRIRVVELKLLGYNPVYLTEKELRAGIMGRHPDYLEAYVKLLKGDHQFNIRARLADEDLTVEQQVKCLIDLATDTAVLGCAYKGFLPWI